MAKTLHPSTIQRAKINNLEWVRVSRNQPHEINTLKKLFHFHPIDLQETLPPLQRHKLVVRDEYIFMILLYPVFDRKTKTIYSSEVDFFISPNRLVTVNQDGLPAMQRVFSSFIKTTKELFGPENVCAIDGMAHLLYTLLSELLEDVYPMLVHLSADSDAIEKRIFVDYERNLIQELLRVKTNIVNVRKAMQGHKKIISSLLATAQPQLAMTALAPYFDRLIEHTKEVWDMLEVERDTINALHETNASLIDYRINEIMKTLTIFSVIVFPLTLLAAVFGMNTKGIPFVDHPQGFWAVFLLMILCTFGMLLFFRRKKWL